MNDEVDNFDEEFGLDDEEFNEEDEELQVFEVRVTETYEKVYTVEATCVEEAIDKAQEMADDDFDITAPENMIDRQIDV